MVPFTFSQQCTSTLVAPHLEFYFCLFYVSSSGWCVRRSYRRSCTSVSFKKFSFFIGYLFLNSNTGSPYITQAALEFMILLPQAPES
jgi:hypothetical protein